MAEPNQSTTGTPASAAGDELTIPKHRFDEVNNELRRVREEGSIKDRLYLEERQRAMQAQRQPVADITAEETGLEPQVHQAVMKVANKVAERIVAERSAVYEQQIGILAGRTEKAELLASKGADKAKYLPEVLQRQQDHFRSTGSFLPAETALELILSREKDQRIKELEARVAGGSTTQATATSTATPAAAQTAATQGGIPSAAGTRQMPGGGAAGGAPAPSPANASFKDLSIEEMEARLSKQFEEGATL